MLVKHIEKLTLSRKGLSIFLPLCGKSLDIPYLASLGLDVVGVEFVQDAIEQFFNENSITFTMKQLDLDFKLFTV